MRRLFMCLFCLSLLHGCRGQQEDYGSALDRDSLLAAHNQHRSTALKVSGELEEAAQKWAEKMAAADELDHGDFKSRISGNWRMIGENIAAGQRSVESVMRSWMNSRGHRQNILNEQFKWVGFGIAVSSNGTIYWVADFGG